MNKQVKFSHNWNNKLDNDVFTTIRRYTPEKYKYYMSSIGETFDVVLNGRLYNTSNLEGLFVAEKFKDIHDCIIMLDTGMTDIVKINGLFANFGIKSETKSIIPVFKRIKPLTSKINDDSLLNHINATVVG